MSAGGLLPATLLAAAVLLTSTAAADAHSRWADVMVTVRSTGPTAPTALRRAASPGQRAVLRFIARERARGRVRFARRLWIVDEVHLVADRDVVARLRGLASVASVRPNRILRAAPARRARGAGVPPFVGAGGIGADALWERGINGRGVVVAVLDSGVDASHPALAGSFRGGRGSWFDPSRQHPRTPVDSSGHGTWATGIIVGSGAAGTPVGVAPGARWIAAKVFDDRGRTTPARIHAAFQWALDPDGDPRTADAPQVVNASWDMVGGGCDLEFEPDLRELRRAGILPVFAAGNDGRDASPANNPSALAVGAIDARGALAFGSGRGPSSCGAPVYPALVAPGVDVATTDLLGLSTTQTGTSVAAPYVSGALALLLDRFPGTTAERQEAALTSTTTDLGRAGPDRQFGHGRVDVDAAATWLERAPDLTLVPARWSIGARAGGRTTARVSVRALRGFSGRVRLSGSAAIAGAGVRLPRELRVSASTAMRVQLTVPRGTRAGSYPLTISARSGRLTRSLTLGLVVRDGLPRRASP